MFVQMYPNLLLIVAFLAAFRTLWISFAVFSFPMLGSIIISGERFSAVRTLIRLLTGVLSAMMIPRIFPPKAHVTIFTDERLFTGMQQHVIVQRFSVVESFLALRAFVASLPVMFALNMVHQQLFHSVRGVAQVALVNRVHSSLVNSLLVRFQRHLVLKLLVALGAFVPRFLFC